MENQLRKLQLTQVEILKVIDKLCRKYDIPYSLYAGTLLGAVRHKGFIPWDDDLDICMSRENYNRFQQAWETDKPEGYLLQNKENAPDFTQSFTKIRKVNSTCQLKVEIGLQYHMGIYVDVFPVDRFPEGKLRQLEFRLNCMLYQLFSREFLPPESSRIVKCICGLILMVTPKRWINHIRGWLLKHITRYSDDTSLPGITIETMAALNTLYPADMLDNYVRLPFEDGEFQCFADWDGNLRRKFGDYMQLPPEEERTWRHPPLRIDFEKHDIVTE